MLVTFENRTGYESYIPDAWTRRHPPAAFAHLCYDVAAATTMTQYLGLARQRGAGWIYVTDDGAFNPWDRLPAFWGDEVAGVRQLNASAPVNLEASLHTADSIRVRIDGIPGRYVLESSPDLLRWLYLDWAPAPTGRVELIVTIDGVSGRYLRAWR
jgi:hypothetical protein